MSSVSSAPPRLGDLQPHARRADDEHAPGAAVARDRRRVQTDGPRPLHDDGVVAEQRPEPLEAVHHRAQRARSGGRLRRRYLVWDGDDGGAGWDVVVLGAAAQQVRRAVGAPASEPDAVVAERRLVRHGAVEAVAAEAVRGDDAVALLERIAVHVVPLAVHGDDAACGLVAGYVGQHARVRTVVPDVHVGPAERRRLDLQQQPCRLQLRHLDVAQLGRVVESRDHGSLARLHGVSSL